MRSIGRIRWTVERSHQAGRLMGLRVSSCRLSLWLRRPAEAGVWWLLDAPQQFVFFAAFFSVILFDPL